MNLEIVKKNEAIDRVINGLSQIIEIKLMQLDKLRKESPNSGEIKSIKREINSIKAKKREYKTEKLLISILQ